MRYDELISTSIKAIKEFDPKIEGPNSFVERFLKKVIKLIICTFLDHQRY